MSDSSKHQARYPLRAVIRRTGLSADVIRAWERRYGAVTPERSAGGQRLYSERDVRRLSLLGRATSEGHSIGEIARLDSAALEALLRTSVTRAARPDQDEAREIVRAALRATEQLDASALEMSLKRGVFSIGAERFVGEVVGEFLTEVGERWHRGAISPAHEHLASDTVRRVLGWITDAYDLPDNAPVLVVATPAGELHELGAMTVAAAAVGEGWRVVYLGASLPASDIASAALQVGAGLVALSVVYANGEASRREVAEIARAVEGKAPVVVGGASAQRWQMSHDAGVRVLGDMEMFRLMLRSERASRSADPAGA